jgi:hypothetical protein
VIQALETGKHSGTQVQSPEFSADLGDIETFSQESAFFPH